MATNGTTNGTTHEINGHSTSHDPHGVNEVNGLPFYKPTPADIEINNHKPTDKGKIFFKNVNIFDSTGADPYQGSALIEGERITVRQENIDEWIVRLSHASKLEQLSNPGWTHELVHRRTCVIYCSVCRHIP